MIRIVELHKSFGNNSVLRGVNLDLASGKSLVIIGGSGTGKSVTIKCILGLVEPTSGQIFINGQDTKTIDRNDFLSQFGMVFQNSALFDSLSVWQNVSFRLLHGRLKKPREEARNIALDRLRRVGLKSEVADKYPAELSGGMQKRVGLARAIVTHPKIIFFDEPTTGLDPIMSSIINDLIREVVAEIKATTITITHDMNSARVIGDTVAMLHDGKIRWSGSLKEMDQSDDPYLNQFIHGRADGPISAGIGW